MKESYENMELLLEKIQYEKYNWNFCGELKVLLSCLATKHFVAFCVSGIVGTEKGTKCSINQPWKSIFTSAAHQTWTHKKYLQGNGSKLRWIYVFEK